MSHVFQPSMFGGAELRDDIDPKVLARRDDPATSKQAAARVASFAGDHYALILAAMRVLARPAGAEQISATLLRGGVKLDAYQVRKRLPELANHSKVRVATADEGVAVRETSSGRHERLWELAH